jgi:citrate synthase
MGILIGTVGALSTFYPDSKQIFDPESRVLQIHRLIAKMPSLAAFSYRHSIGFPYAYPDNELSYCGNFLNMMFKTTELQYQPNPVVERALNVLFILHADHEQNCSTTAMRVVGSSHSDPYVCVAAAASALYGPRQGANEGVLRMLTEIGTPARIPQFLGEVREGAKRLIGFGHPVYRSYDPRARIVKKLAQDVVAVTGGSRLLEIALDLERQALGDEYFASRRLFPNVNFYSGIVYQALGFPVEMFPVLFAIPRTAGWLAQWLELIGDPEQKIARPRQAYRGEPRRGYVPVDARG